MTDSITNKHGTEIRAGQIWADNDSRSEGRTLRVCAIELGCAICEVVTEIGGKKPARLGRKVRIKLDRLHPTSTGYRLVSEAAIESENRDA